MNFNNMKSKLNIIFLFLLISSSTYAQYNVWPNIQNPYNQNPYNPSNQQIVKLKNGNKLIISKGFCPICRGSGRCIGCQYSFPCRVCGGTMRCTQCGGAGGTLNYVVFSSDGQYFAQSDQYGNPVGPWRSVVAANEMRKPDTGSRKSTPNKSGKEKVWFDCCTKAIDFNTGATHRCPECQELHRMGYHAHFIYK